MTCWRFPWWKRTAGSWGSSRSISCSTFCWRSTAHGSWAAGSISSAARPRARVQGLHELYPPAAPPRDQQSGDGQAHDVPRRHGARDHHPERRQRRRGHRHLLAGRREFRLRPALDPRSHHRRSLCGAGDGGAAGRRDRARAVRPDPRAVRGAHHDVRAAGAGRRRFRQYDGRVLGPGGGRGDLWVVQVRHRADRRIGGVVAGLQGHLPHGGAGLPGRQPVLRDLRGLGRVRPPRLGPGAAGHGRPLLQLPHRLHRHARGRRGHHDLPVETVKDAALALGPLAGKYAGALFAFGLINASLFSASILPLATSYYVCEALGFESGINRTIRQAPVFYGLYGTLIVGACVVVLLPNAPLLRILVLSQVANGVLLPLILLFMLLLVNSKRLMGKYTNSRACNAIAWVTVVVMIALTLALMITQIFPVGS